MAARKVRLKLDEKWRASIQTGVLLNRLFQHANGSVEMKATQVKSAEILLRKTIPDLSDITIKGDPENPLTIAQVERHVVKAR